jgi:hypothetical protein
MYRAITRLICLKGYKSWSAGILPAKVGKMPALHRKLSMPVPCPFLTRLKGLSDVAAYGGINHAHGNQ